VANIFGDSHGFVDFFGDGITFFCVAGTVSDVSDGLLLPLNFFPAVPAVVVASVVESAATFLGELSRRIGIFEPEKNVLEISIF
jgi:hypothetical protein